MTHTKMTLIVPLLLIGCLNQNADLDEQEYRDRIDEEYYLSPAGTPTQNDLWFVERAPYTYRSGMYPISVLNTRIKPGTEILQQHWNLDKQYRNAITPDNSVASDWYEFTEIVFGEVKDNRADKEFDVFGSILVRANPARKFYMSPLVPDRFGSDYLDRMIFVASTTLPILNTQVNAHGWKIGVGIPLRPYSPICTIEPNGVPCPRQDFQHLICKQLDVDFGECLTIQEAQNQGWVKCWYLSKFEGNYKTALPVNKCPVKDYPLWRGPIRLRVVDIP